MPILSICLQPLKNSYRCAPSTRLLDINMETQGHVIPKSIAELMVKIVAKEVDRVLDTAMTQLCNGCQIDHPSQHQHDCIMIEDRESRVFYGLRQALKMLNWNEVKQDFFHRVSMSQLLRCGSCFDDVNWWRNLWKEATWEELLIDCLLAEEV